MTKRTLPASLRAQAKAMIGETRRARGMSPAALAELAGISPRTLEEYERPGGPSPSRPLIAALGYALGEAALPQLLLPAGWLILSPDQVGLVSDALVAAGIVRG